MGSPEHKQKIWKLISEIGTGMLVTDDDGSLRARPMQLVQDNYDGKLWFFTRIDSAKSEEIFNDRDVCINFSDTSSKTFVSMSGRARVTTDKELVNRFWGPTVEPWFPEGKDHPSCGLIEIKITHGEHWDSDVSKLGFIYEMTKAKLTDTLPDVGENEKF